MTVADIIQGLRAMEARNAKLEAENAALRAQVSAAGGDPAAAPELNADGLRACPFCGRHDALVISGGLRVFVACLSNGVDSVGPTADTESAAIAAWNTRR